MFNNLGLALGMVLKFNVSEAKELKLKVRRWGLILTFLEVTGEKLVGGVAFCPLPYPIMNRIKAYNFQKQSFKNVLYLF